MATKKIYDLSVKTGEYQKDGETKNRYINIGSILQKDDGGKFLIMNRYINLAGIPNPDDRDTVIVSMFDVNKDSGSQPVPNAPADNPFTDDTIPF